MNALERALAEPWTPSRDEIQLWRAPVSEADTARGELEPLLDDEERARAARFIFEHDRVAFVFRRAFMRARLARCLSIEPQDVRYVVGPQGKLSLAPPFDEGGLKFNLSHSRGLVYLVITQHREVGVDVERIRTDIDLDSLARHTFSTSDMEIFASLQPDQRHDAFFAAWTRKEAVLKAIGVGLSHPLDSVGVTFAPGVPAALREYPDAFTGGAWSVTDVEAGEGYRAAVAAAGSGWRLVAY